MRYRALSGAVLAMILLAGCQESVTDQRADQVRENADRQADAVEKAGKTKADAIERAGEEKADAIERSDDGIQRSDTSNTIKNNR